MPTIASFTELQCFTKAVEEGRYERFVASSEQQCIGRMKGVLFRSVIGSASLS